MVRFTLGFPLGVYYARSTTDEAEWPPAPLRLAGALIAAAHGRHGVDPAAERAAIQRLCEASPPLIVAPESTTLADAADDEAVVRLRGITRWAPRNYLTGPVSPRNLGRDRAAVSKPGVAVGDRQVAIVWPDVELAPDELERLKVLASDVAFLGTTRSPVIVEVDAAASGDLRDTGVWAPAEGADFDATVRVPDPATISMFDRRHAGRRSRSVGVERGGMVPEIAIGTPVRYVSPSRRRAAAETIDPCWWGEMIVLQVDRAASETVPKAPAAYLLARAVRVALLGAYAEPGTTGEAPPILRARGGDPHCAIVPLPTVGHDHADGVVRGVAVVFPHEARHADVHEQRAHVERGLAALIGGDREAPRRHVAIPGAGRIWLKRPDAMAARLATLREDAYRAPSATWTTVTPIVHSRWRKGGADAVLEQLAADCAHVGLPAPERVELLRTAGRRGGADRAIPLSQVPERWRSLLDGPSSHVHITFPRPVRGPVLIGRARHFGLGLCVPAPASERREVA